MTTHTIPTEDQIAEIFLDKLGKGISVMSIDAPSVLGVSAAEIKQAQNRQTFVAPSMSASYLDSRAKLGEKAVSTASRVWTAGASKDIQSALKEWADAGGVWSTMEWSVGAGVPVLTKNIPNDFLGVQFVHAACLFGAEKAGVALGKTSHIPFDGVDYELCPAGYIEWVLSHTKWQAVTVNGATVAATNGDGRTLLVFANILGCDDRTGWTKSTKDTDFLAKQLSFLAAIVKSAKSKLKNVTFHQGGQDAQYLDTLRNRAGYVDTLKAMIRSEIGKLDAEGQRLETDIRKKQKYVNQYSMQLAQSLGEVTRYDAALQTLPNTEGAPGMLGPIQTLLQARHEIGKLDFVKSVEVTPDHTQRTLKIVVALHPAHVDMNGDLRIIPSLSVAFSTRHEQLAIAISRGKHPHSQGESIDWGAVAMPVAEAIGRNNWTTVMRLISRWVTTYDVDTAHLDSQHFKEAAAGSRKGFDLPAAATKVAVAS